MRVSSDIMLAVRVLLDGGVIAYPTEGVWGLGCHPFDRSAVSRLLAIKQRSVTKGLILLVTEFSMLKNLVADVTVVEDGIASRESSLQLTGPTTWLLPALPTAPVWLTGGTGCIAVRRTEHELARELVAQFAMPLVSTSANLSGEPAVTRVDQLSSAVTAQVELVVAGTVGDLTKPTPIYDLVSGRRIRG